MRLQSKLALFSAASKVVILLVLIAALPTLVNKVALHNADVRLQQKEAIVYQLIEDQGIETYIPEGTTSYGSYNLLKEEFVSLEEISSDNVNNGIATALRKVEGDIVEYRLLSSTFDLGDKRYLLEIGRSTETIGENSQTLQTYALFFLVAVVLITVFVDLAYNKVLLKPLTLIVRRLQRVEHPTTFKPHGLNTSTDDFLYLNNTINDMMGQIQEAFQKEKEFIGNVSHELLTPISIMQNRLENLLSDSDTPETLLEKLVDNLRTLHRLKGIIQALLLISRIENEQYLKDESVSLEALVREVCEEITERAEVREVTLEVHVPTDYVIPQANQSLLFTMLFNVVNNAIKYNKPGGTIILRGESKPEGYSLCVTDTGVGIAEEQLPFIFSRFKRFHAPDGESHGLGLPIVQTIASFHHITLHVQSKLGQGTTFCFEFKDA